MYKLPSASRRTTKPLPSSTFLNVLIIIYLLRQSVSLEIQTLLVCRVAALQTAAFALQHGTKPAKSNPSSRLAQIFARLRNRYSPLAITGFEKA
jgi:hypothetical protein